MKNYKNLLKNKDLLTFFEWEPIIKNNNFSNKFLKKIINDKNQYYISYYQNLSLSFIKTYMDILTLGEYHFFTNLRRMSSDSETDVEISESEFLDNVNYESSGNIVVSVLNISKNPTELELQNKTGSWNGLMGNKHFSKAKIKKIKKIYGQYGDLI